ncbi:unnamed protein product [Caenorhabditis auriculariae]|uniref:Uncharacterized protein n=1 Tax=Caenorhabditis auriculariae TaxID=2777116 RepID=A0A8S1HXJ1_9PELO|nr:unnamed protein product [Caenorhabditis auriculariae]
MNVAITDLICSAALGFVMSRVVMIGDNLAYIFHGPCKYFGNLTCFYGHAIMLHGMAHCMMLTVISFGYRLFVLRHPSPTKKMLWLTIALFYLPSFAMFLTFISALETDPKVIEALKEQRNNVDWNIVPHVFLQSFFTISNGGSATYLFLVAMVGCFAVIIMRRKAHLILQRVDNSLSSSTKRVHKTLMKALAIQASLPFLMYIADLIFTAMHFFHIQHSAVENSVFLLLMFPPALSPILSIYYVQPYRIGLKEWVTKVKKQKVQTINTVSTTRPSISRSLANSDHWN